MIKSIKPLWDQFGILVWFIIVVEAFIFCLAIIIGNTCGYKNSLIAHGILGLLVGTSLAILLISLICVNKIIDYILSRQK